MSWWIRAVAMLLAAAAMLSARESRHDYSRSKGHRGRLAAGQSNAPDGATVSYTALDHTEYSLVQYKSLHVSFLIQPASLQLRRYTVSQLRGFMDHLDVLYAHFAEIMGDEPSGPALLPIAFVNTCGAGCSMIGSKGIELDPGILDPAHLEYPDGSPYVYAIHEMAHNFDFYSDWIMYGPDPAHSWTDFMNYYITVYNREGFRLDGAGRYPDELMRHVVSTLFQPYLDFPGASWTRCIENDACSPDTGMAQHTQGGLMMRVAQLHGEQGVKQAMRYLKTAIGGRDLNSDDMSDAAKNDLLLESLAHGAGVNVGCYADQWKWPISTALRSQLQKLYGDNPNCQDADHDGYSVAQGDCNDHSPSVHPGAAELLNGIDDDCNGLVDDLAYQESGSFPQSSAAALAVNFPARISGSISASANTDFFRFNVGADSRVRLTLHSIDTLAGALFIRSSKNTGWLEYKFVRPGGTAILESDLPAGTYTISIAPSRSTALGRYEASLEPVQAWPTSLSAPAPRTLSPTRRLLAAPEPPADVAQTANIMARFWVSGAGWVGSAALSNGAASLAWDAPAGAGCPLSYRVQFVSGDLPVSPASLPVMFSGSGTPCFAADAVVNAASFLSGAVAPGELVSIFGGGLGPDDLAPLQLDAGGSVAAELADTTVSFDGRRAPLVYAWNSVTTAVVPFEVAGRSSTQLVVSSGGRTSASALLSVAAAAPALFENGGLAAAINQDNSINSVRNPAPAGTVISLFGTGFGQTAPALSDGTVARGSGAKIGAPVQVSIGQAPAVVIYAGAAPGEIAGVTQLNVRIPAGAGSGIQPVGLTVAGTPSLEAVSIVVQ